MRTSSAMSTKREPTLKAAGAGGVEYGPKADAGVPTLAELRRRLLLLMPEALRVLEYHLKRKSLVAAIFVLEGTGVAVRYVRHEGVGWTPNAETIPAKSQVQ
jgi:hypothetical protein